MKQNKIPLNRSNLYVIVEGDTDKIFLEAYLNGAQTKFKVICLKAIGIGNVINKLYATKSKFPDSHVLVFVDLDREGQSRIEDLWNKIVQKGLTQLIKKHEIFFVNPCIEYLFIIAKENNHPKFCTNKQYKDEKERIYGTDFDAKIIELLQEDKFETLNHNLCRVQKAADDYPSTNIEDLVTYLKRKRP